MTGLSGGVAASAPDASSSFIGREDELAQLGELLERSRLITVVGAPGMGKTRLARELCRRRSAASRFVDLAPIGDPASVLRALAVALAVPEVAEQGLLEGVIARLRAERVLLVLDNCEHLVVACGELCGVLLAGASELSILATSRERLGVAGESVWLLAPLGVPERGEALPAPEALLRYPAVGLFLERAQAAQPEFVLNGYVAPAVVEICRRLDGIPLAIELAAARVDMFTPAEIARRLEGRVGLPSDPGVPDTARHRTLEEALDWSYGLLSPAERALLRRLSVFVGGFELESAEAVCAGGELGRVELAGTLASLVSKSLVALDPERDSPSQTSHRLLETVRAYASDRLEQAGEAPACREAHARFCLDLAEELEPELTGPGQVCALERLDRERENLRRALEWSLGHGHHELALRLAGSLVLFWRVRCHFSEGRDLLDAAVSASDGAAPALKPKALWGLGFLTLMAGDPDAAMPALEESLERARELNDLKGCARALLVIGNCQLYREGASAMSLLEESAALARKAQDSWCLAHALALAGWEHYCREDLAAARPLLEECLEVARGHQDKQSLRLGLVMLGSLAVTQDDSHSAEPLLGEALLVAEELRDDYVKAKALESLGDLAFAAGEYERSQELLERALAIQEAGPPVDLVFPLVSLAAVTRATGERSRARLLLEEALRLAGGDVHARMAALQGAGELAADDGEEASARRRFEEALELARAHDAKRAAARALAGLGYLARGRGDVTRAASLHAEALTLRCQSGDVRGVASSLEALAGLAAATGRCEHAADLFGAAEGLRVAKGYARAPWESSAWAADTAVVRQSLAGPDFSAAFTRGAGRSMTQAVAVASREARHPRSVSGWASLTARERELAALVAEGLTNPQIANRLMISLRTVKDHMSHIFSKLGIARRSELAREVSRREHG